MRISSRTHNYVRSGAVVGHFWRRRKLPGIFRPFLNICCFPGLICDEFRVNWHSTTTIGGGSYAEDETSERSRDLEGGAQNRTFIQMIW